MIKVQHAEELATFTGDLTRATITRAFDKKYRKLVEGKKITLNFSKVSHVDTAGLAWILLLIELAVKNNCELFLSNMSEDFIKLAKLSGVDGFLPNTDH